MSVPPELMKLMAGGGGGPKPPAAPAPGMPPPGEAPPGGPMSAPQPKEGLTQAAMAKLSMVFDLLEQALSVFGSETEEGKVILGALKMLSGKFGAQRPQGQAIAPAALMELVQSLPGAGGGGPAAKSLGGMPPSQPAMPAAA